jgi:hypothetical protein
MQTANGRGATQLSDKCVDKLQTPQQVADCIVRFPIGAAQQKAAIAAIGFLGGEYLVLRQPALEGLNDLTAEFGKNDPTTEVAQRALTVIESRAVDTSSR